MEKLEDRDLGLVWLGSRSGCGLVFGLVLRFVLLDTSLESGRRNCQHHGRDLADHWYTFLRDFRRLV